MYYFIYKWLLLFPIRYRFSLQRRIILVANIKDSCMKLPLILSHRYIISIRHNHMVNQRNIYQCKRLFHPNSGLQICSRGQRKTAGMIMSENRLSSIIAGRDEYQCDCAGYCGGWPCEMNPVLLDKIEALRCACGSPVIITSGVRCEARNDEVGGVPWSFHKRGGAADLYCPGVSVGDLAQMAQTLGMNVLPYYGSGYIHVEI